jgi:hypothetical protein
MTTCSVFSQGPPQRSNVVLAIWQLAAARRSPAVQILGFSSHIGRTPINESVRKLTVD